MMKKITISEIGRVVTGNTPPRNQPDLYGSHTIFIKPTDVSLNSKYTYAPEECYSEKGYEKYKSSLIPKGATCVVTIGSIGKKMTIAHEECFLNQAMNAIIPNENYDNEYIYYLLKNNLSKLKTLDSGTTSGRENISKSAFSNMELYVIDNKESQARIGQIFSTYDDLIENNQKQIKLLEEAAMLLFKEWFVKLRFPNYENTKIVDGVPDGWENGKIKDFFYTTSGGTPSRQKTEYFQDGDIPWVKTKELCDGYILTTEEQINQQAVKESSAKIFDAGSVLLAMYGTTIGKLGISSMKMACNQACCVLNAKTINVSNEFIFYWLLTNRDFLVQQGKGAAQPNLSQEVIKNFSIRIPAPNVMVQFSAFCKHLNQQYFSLQKNISLLIEARDKLLPKLMNGEIEV